MAFAGICLAVGLGGCATNAPAASAPVADQAQKKVDPWENWNRKVYSFNDRLDTAVVKPVAVTYVKVVPQPVRTGVTNFYANFSDAWSAVNNVLQGKVGQGMEDVARVGTNTVLGVAGLFDVASDLGLEPHGEDFGQTLGRWGFGAGPYIVWPFLGPSSVRDSIAMPLDRAVSPALAVHTDVLRVAVTGLGLIDERVNLLPTTRLLDDMALDKYSFVRDAYLQRRRSLVYDGNEPPPAPEPLPVVGVGAPSPTPAADAPPAPAIPASGAK